MPACAIESLNLSNNHVNDAGVAALVDALRSNASLTELQLENRGISMDGKIMMLKLVMTSQASKQLYNLIIPCG